MIRFGRYEITLINFGSFRLDGGAMFGSVPKNLWEKRLAPDNENCIPLALRCMLLQDGKRTILVDVGMGDKWGDKQREIFAIKSVPDGTLGINPEEVTDIILTHLHFDHSGGISKYAKNSRAELELCYPNAVIHLQNDNWINAQNPNVKERASYLKENVLVLREAKLSLHKGNIELLPDIYVHQVNGHTLGQQWIEVRNGDESIVYPTDLIPTSHHLPVPFHMGYDICADTLLREKEAFLSDAEAKGSIIVFEHDINVEAARVAKDARGHFAVKEVVTI